MNATVPFTIYGNRYWITLMLSCFRKTGRTGIIWGPVPVAVKGEWEQYLSGIAF
jgi:hypothetical protein